jgi:PAS domain S-box-containing protein
MNKRLTGANLENKLFSTISRSFLTSIENNYTDISSEFSIIIDSIKYIVRSTPYHGPEGLRWNVLVIIPENDYMSAFYRASTWGITSLIVFLIITLFSSYIIAGQTSKPIVKLSNLVHGISPVENKINELIIPNKLLERQDEIGTLTEAFLDMKTRLDSTFTYLKQSQKEYKDLVENINSIIMRIRPDGIITYCNPFGLAFYGYDKEELIGSFVQNTVLKTNDPQDIDVLRKIFVQDEKYWNGINKNITSHGNEVWILWSNSLISDKDGNIIELLSIGQDFTSRKEAERDLNKSLAEKNILLKEIHHRVKNNLQIIDSLINLQLAELTDNIVQDNLESLQSRIQSMALVHEMLYSRDSFSQIDFHDYLNQIIISISATFNNIENPIKISLKGITFSLDIERATTCGLLVNEILINSFKHAFKNQKDCRINVTLGKNDSGEVSIIIKDNGIGISTLNNSNNKSGMGSLLIEALTDQIGGEFIIRKNQGTIIKLIFQS